MLRKILFMLLLAVLASSALFAQDLHIYYDAYADSVYYAQNGKRISQPAVRKGSNVVLHVNNYNNYLYNVQLKTQNAGTSLAQAHPLDASSLRFDEGSNPLGLLFGGGSPLGSMPDLLGLSRGSGAAATPAEQERLARISEIEKQVSGFNKALTRAQARTEEVALIQKKVQTALEAQQIQVFAAEELKRLRLNPQLSPVQLKELSQEYMSRIFDEADPKQINLSKVLKQSDAQGGFTDLKQRYQAQVSGYSNDVAVMKSTSAVLGLLASDVPESNIRRFLAESEKVVTAAEENLMAYEENLQTLDAKTEEVKGLDVRELAELRVDYLVTMENDFSKTFRQTASSDEMGLQLVFVPVDSINISGLSTKSVSPIEVKVYGGMKVNASLGLSFGQFFTPPQSYFVRDSLISSSDKDSFTPFLTSFVHFYPQGRREASLGGSFGVGIPLGGTGSSLEALTFFLGPSLILGRNQRIVLSAGLIGGRVEQLANGYAVGDRFELSPDFLQTESVYKLGYSLGLSFNLVGN